jgi:MoaA/NifB/PqqE/SkfB family radical SAM enzyme
MRRLAIRKYAGYLQQRGAIFKLANFGLNLIERGLRRERLWSMPPHVSIDPGNVCNLSCPGCVTGTRQPDRMRPRAMKPAEFEVIVDSVERYVFTLSLYNWGEPFMVRDIFRMIAYARSKGLAVTVHSNMTWFDEEKARATVESGLTHVYCSIDGATQQVYSAYRRGGDLALACRNLVMLLDARRRAGVRHPFVTWKYLVFPHNAHEVEAARAMAAEMGVDDFEVFTGTVDVGFWTGRQLQRDGTMAELDPPDRCRSLWSSLFVNPGGRVTPCCQSYREGDIFDNLIEHGLGSVWNNARYREARRLFTTPLAAGVTAPMPCRDCAIIPKAQSRLLSR